MTSTRPTINSASSSSSAWNPSMSFSSSQSSALSLSSGSSGDTPQPKMGLLSRRSGANHKLETATKSGPFGSPRSRGTTRSQVSMVSMKPLSNPPQRSVRRHVSYPATTKPRRKTDDLKDEEILSQLADEFGEFYSPRKCRSTTTLSVNGSPVPAQNLGKRRDHRAARHKPWTEPAPTQLKPKKGVRAETHYESCLPTEQWAQMKQNSYVTNHKYGNSFKVTKKHGKSFKPDKEELLIENEFRVWLFEKSKDTKFELDADRYIKNKTSKKDGKDGKGDVHVGPHKDLYEQFHAEKLRKSAKEKAAVTIQRWMKGWVLRARIKRLSSRILLKHGHSLLRFSHEYKGLLTRIQKRYKIKKPRIPFDLAQVENFLDRKEKYEKVFYDRNVADKIARPRLKLFFKECGLIPTEKEINIAFQAVFRGCGSKAEIAFVVDCSSSLGDTNFQIQQDFMKEMIKSLHVGENNIRIAFIPYNTDVFQCFGLDAYGTREDVVKGIEHVKYHKGVERTDVALKKMKDILKTGREGVPRTCIVITDGGSYASYATDKQSTLAKKQKITIVAVGVGTNVDSKELITMASDRSCVFNVPDYYSLSKIKTDVMKKVGLANCTYCNSVAPEELRHDDRGLFKSEVFELIWMIFPPLATGLDPVNRARWMKKFADEEYTDVVGDAEDEAAFNTCLEFVIKDKLERDGILRTSDYSTGVEGGDDWGGAINMAEEYMKAEKARGQVVKPKPRLLNVRRTEC